jgi:methylmalonyl-CoA carboxyltransferase small subunit
VKLKLTVDGKLYEVDVEVTEPEAPRPAYVPPSGHARTPAMPAPAAAPVPEGGQDAVADENKVCRSPLSGLVVRIAAQAGQDVAASDVLMVLEAMKMETEVTSPRSGKIAKVNVSPGDSVKTGQVLVEFE